jgi:hypothetical protein
VLIGTYQRVTNKEVAQRIPYEMWVCVVKKTPLSLLYKVTEEKLQGYEILKEYEGCFCLFDLSSLLFDLDRSVFRRMVTINKPPSWSLFTDHVEYWDWHQIGDSYSIYLPKEAR